MNNTIHDGENEDIDNYNTHSNKHNHKEGEGNEYIDEDIDDDGDNLLIESRYRLKVVKSNQKAGEGKGDEILYYRCTLYLCVGSVNTEMDDNDDNNDSNNTTTNNTTTSSNNNNNTTTNTNTTTSNNITTTATNESKKGTIKHKTKTSTIINNENSSERSSNGSKNSKIATKTNTNSISNSSNSNNSKSRSTTMNDNRNYSKTTTNVTKINDVTDKTEPTTSSDTNNNNNVKDRPHHRAQSGKPRIGTENKNNIGLLLPKLVVKTQTSKSKENDKLPNLVSYSISPNEKSYEFTTTSTNHDDSRSNPKRLRRNIIDTIKNDKKHKKQNLKIKEKVYFTFDVVDKVISVRCRLEKKRPLHRTTFLEKLSKVKNVDTTRHVSKPEYYSNSKNNNNKTFSYQYHDKNSNDNKTVDNDSESPSLRDTSVDSEDDASDNVKTDNNDNVNNGDVLTDDYDNDEYKNNAEFVHLDKSNVTKDVSEKDGDNNNNKKKEITKRFRDGSKTNNLKHKHVRSNTDQILLVGNDENRNHVTSKDGHVTSRDSHVTSRDSHVTSRHGHVTRKHSHVTSRDSHVTRKHSHVTSKDRGDREERVAQLTWTAIDAIIDVEYGRDLTATMRLVMNAILAGRDGGRFEVERAVEVGNVNDGGRNENAGGVGGDDGGGGRNKSGNGVGEGIDGNESGAGDSGGGDRNGSGVGDGNGGSDSGSGGGGNESGVGVGGDSDGVGADTNERGGVGGVSFGREEDGGRRKYWYTFWERIDDQEKHKDEKESEDGKTKDKEMKPAGDSGNSDDGVAAVGDDDDEDDDDDDDPGFTPEGTSKLAIYLQIFGMLASGFCTHAAYRNTVEGRRFPGYLSVATLVASIFGIASSVLWSDATDNLTEHHWAFWPYIACFFYILLSAITILAYQFCVDSLYPEEASSSATTASHGRELPSADQDDDDGTQPSHVMVPHAGVSVSINLHGDGQDGGHDDVDNGDHSYAKGHVTKARQINPQEDESAPLLHQPTPSSQQSAILAITPTLVSSSVVVMTTEDDFA